MLVTLLLEEPTLKTYLRQRERERDNLKYGQEAMICSSFTFGNTLYDMDGLFSTLIIFWPVWIHSNTVTRFQVSDLWPNSRYYSTELMSQNDRIITTRECSLEAMRMCQYYWVFGLCASSGILKTWRTTTFHILPVFSSWQSLISGVYIPVVILIEVVQCDWGYLFLMDATE